jgi:O-antigen/teichoic acid export membrane protein
MALGELKRFSRNSFFLGLSYALRFAVGLLVFVFVVKRITQEDFGRLSFALTLSAFFGVAADFGLHTLTVRNIAQDASLAPRYYRNILTLKILLSVIAFAGIVLFVNVLGYSSETKLVVYPIAAFMFISSLGTYHYFLFRGLERMDLEAGASLVHNASLIVCVFGVVLLADGKFPVSVGYVTTGYLAAGIISTVIIFVLLGRHVGRPGLSVDPAFWGKLLKESSYFAFFAMLGLIYIHVDTVMLSKLRPDPEKEIALYQAPVRLLGAAVMIVAVVINVYLPILSRRFKGPRDDFISLVKTLNRIGVTLIAPIAVFTMIYNKEIVEFFFRKEYEESGRILVVLSLATLVWFAPPYGVVFAAMDKQRINFFVAAACAGANVVLNLIFIPRYGAIAAAATTLGTYLLQKAFYAAFSRKYLGSALISPRFVVALLLCAALAGGLRLTNLHLIAAGAVFCALYAVFSYLLILSREEKLLCLRLAGLTKPQEVQG